MTAAGGGTEDPDALPDLDAAQILEMFASGERDPAGYARALCARNRARDPELSVWAWFDEAAFLDAAAAASTGSGPLGGLPVAVKDIFDTADMPTECGSPLLKGRRPIRDAAAVAAIRAAGGIVMGKTVTTEFANAFPGPTRNPHDPRRTPGGSSSGSAAAVAAGIAPLAVGTQTAGSVIRPAAYCGVIGFKPSFGRINRAGALPFSDSLDTVGAFARSVGDAWLLAEVLAGEARPAPLAAADRPPRVGLCETPEWAQAAPETLQAIDDAAARLAEAGAVLAPVRLPEPAGDLLGLQKRIMAFEAARAFAHERRVSPERLSPQLTEVLDEGAAISAEAYGEMVLAAQAARRAWRETFETIDVALTASVVGEAPLGLEHTGDPVFNRIWTLLHGPCLHLPTARGPGGMPVGVQLVGPLWGDASFIRFARWIADRIRRA